MAKSEKTAAVAEIADEFRGATAAILTEYRGLSVSQLTELRRTLGPGAHYSVVKNTLTKIAAHQVGVDSLDDLLVGPTAVAFVTGDPVEAAKGLRDFAKANPALVLKGGVVEGKPMSVDDLRRLADLSSREVLLATMAGAMNGVMAKAAGLFAAPVSQVARLAEALRAKLEAEAAGDTSEPVQATTAE